MDLMIMPPPLLLRELTKHTGFTMLVSPVAKDFTCRPWTSSLLLSILPMCKTSESTYCAWYLKCCFYPVLYALLVVVINIQHDSGNLWEKRCGVCLLISPGHVTLHILFHVPEQPQLINMFIHPFPLSFCLCPFPSFFWSHLFYLVTPPTLVSSSSQPLISSFFPP